MPVKGVKATLKKIERELKIKVVKAAKAIEDTVLIDRVSVPLDTGLFRANWKFSINYKDTNDLPWAYFGVTDDQVYDFYNTKLDGGQPPPLISDSQAKAVNSYASLFFNLGDKLYFTNSVDYSDKLTGSTRHMQYFLTMKDNARAVGQTAVKGTLF